MIETAGALMLAALLIEASIGYPQPIYRVVRHPVVWIGALIALCDRALNRQASGDTARRMTGLLTVVVVVVTAAGAAWGVAYVLPNTIPGFAAEALIASTLLAQRSLHAHVAAVGRPLARGDLDAARNALRQIVGRDVTRLDQPGVSRAAIESLSENASDGVVAPALWGAVFGLPGIAAYKAINTLDSMIGHRTPRHEAFGWAAARLDDVANLIPARVTALLLALASATRAWPALACAAADAVRHRSPNAGWPEAAMAGALGVRLSGPRIYASGPSEEPWLNGAARDPGAADIAQALAINWRAWVLLVLLVAGIAAVQA